MTTNSQPEAMEQRIDAALARLPEWQPPADFSARLAATAARQAIPARVTKPEPAWRQALEFFTRRLPMTLWSAGLAAVLVWVVPWGQLAAAGTTIVWTCVTVMGATGVALTLRVLRAP